MELTFGPRKSWALSSKEDTEFAVRKAANLKRKLPPVSKPPQSLAPHDHGDDGGDEDEDEDEDKENQDKDFVVTTKSRKKSERIMLSVPRNLVISALVSSLYRTKKSSNAAKRNLSASTLVPSRLEMARRSVLINSP